MFPSFPEADIESASHHFTGSGVIRQVDINADFTGAMSGNIVARQLARPGMGS